ncbi:MAG: N-acetylmuramoyl-L-alanine amidase [Proteobacteria bacterium]|nr:MAG: N-acetylmuramoyl-L-alanine amidase [Pseudomonadota bacterium]
MLAGRFGYGGRLGAALIGAAVAIGCSVQGAAQGSAYATEAPAAAVAAAFPVASEARLAGDNKRTRFILDLDRKIPVAAFALADPYRVVLDVPQLRFDLAKGTGAEGRGLIKAFRYGLVMAGGSRIVFDLAAPARIAKVEVLEAANGQPARLVLDLAAVDRATFMQALAAEGASKEGSKAPAQTDRHDAAADAAEAAGDSRPVVVIDPGHGGIDNGTQAASGEAEKDIVLEFSLALRKRLEQADKYRIVMTRGDDTFVPLGERVRIARRQRAALFVSIHADSLPRREGDAHGATIYTLSERASDAEAQRLADSENKADAIAGLDLAEEPTEVADILIDLAQRETKTFSHRFAKLLMSEMKGVVRLHKRPLKSAGFKVLKAPDVPSVLVELGYVSNKDDLQLLKSDDWRARSVGAVAQAIEAYLGKRVVSAGPAQ